MFFLERGQSALPGQHICAVCSVQNECNEYAARTNSEYGIWAGEVHSREPVLVIPKSPVLVNDQEVNLTPLTLSASTVQQFLDCPAMFAARAIDKAPDLSGDPASLGTACHAAMEAWVEHEHHKGVYDNDWAVMKAFYDEAYWRLFTDGKRYEEGAKLLQKWLARQDWTRRTVLSVEQKLNFMLPTSAGEIKFNYIMDRMDRLDDGAIEVIDYKTISRPIQPEDLKMKVQPRTYGLAAQMLYPDAERIWVTFDMLRFDPIGIVFTKEENRATYRFLRKTAEAILASDGSLETLNEGCRWCIRKTICATLHNHSSHGGTLALTDPVIAAQRHYDLKNIIGGLNAEANEMEKIALDWMRANDTDAISSDTLDIGVSVSGRRHMDAQRLAAIVGPDIMSRYDNIKVTDVDTMLKVETLTDDQKSRIRQMFTTTYSEPSLKIKPKAII